MQKIRRSVDRIDDEAVGFVPALNRARFFEQKTIARPGAGQFLHQNALGARIRSRNEIGWTLSRDLQIFQFAEVTDKRPSRFSCRGNHHVQGRRQIGHACSLTRKGMTESIPLF